MSTVLFCFRSISVSHFISSCLSFHIIMISYRTMPTSNLLHIHGILPFLSSRNSADNDTASDTNNSERDPDAMDTQEEAETSADAIEREVEMNHNVSRPPPPSQVLHDIQDYFNTDLNEYFIPTSTANASDTSDRAALVMGENDEVVVDWLGLDLHPIVTAADGLVGNMVGAARVLTCESSGDMAVQDADATRSCMEVLGWKSMGGNDAEYDEAYVCRMSGFPNYVDIDARRNTVYATFGPGEGPPWPDLSLLQDLSLTLL